MAIMTVGSPAPWGMMAKGHRLQGADRSHVVCHHRGGLYRSLVVSSQGGSIGHVLCHHRGGVT